MAILGNLLVNLRADSSQFVTAMDRARNKQNAMVGTTRKLGGHMMGFARSMAGIAGIAGMGAMVKGTISSTDRMQKLAIKLGTTAEEISAMGHMATLSGMDLESMGKAMQRMVVNISDAANGTGEAKEAFAALGLDAGKMMKLPLSEQFIAIAGAMEKVTNQSARLNLGDTFFGGRGAGMLQAMEGGAAGVREMLADAERVGAIRNQEQLDAGARAEDAMTRLSASFGGAKDSAILEFADSLSGGLDMIRENMPLIGKMVKDLGTWIGESIAKAVILIERLTRVYDLFKSVYDRASKPPERMGILEKFAPDMTARMKDSTLGRIGTFAAEHLPAAFAPGLALGKGIGAAADIARTVTDPQNADIIKLLKAMLGALQRDSTAVLG